MTTINFQQGDIFKHGIGEYDLCILYGHEGMAFGSGLRQMRERFQPFKEIEHPFEETPNELVFYEDHKALVFVPADFMSEKELKENLKHWLTIAEKQNFSAIAMTGVRDSAKKHLNAMDGAKNDDQRVAFIVCFLQKWFVEHKTKTKIKEILLIAMSDNYIRNFREPIVIG